MTGPYHVDPRIRALGKARIDITRRAQSEAEWQSLWRAPRYTFPFIWESGWKLCIEYLVDDYAAEVGFFIDVLGLPVNAFSPSYAMFTSPLQDFAFSVRLAAEGQTATPADTLRIQFQIRDLAYTVEELQGRGITFEQLPTPDSAFGANLYTASFRTPNGVRVDLVGFGEAELPISLQPFPQPEQAAAETPAEPEPVQAELFPAPEAPPAAVPTEAPIDEPVYTDLETGEESDVDEPPAPLLPAVDRTRRSPLSSPEVHSFTLGRLGSSPRPGEKPRGNGSASRLNPHRREPPPAQPFNRSADHSEEPDEPDDSEP
jgi:catechol 2,3-dioxygenase-like lactoylglutathione lyase family enzyme